MTYTGPFKVQSPKPRGRADSSDGGQFAVLAMELDDLLDVDIRNAVAIGHQKCLATDPRREAFDAPTGLRFQPGVHQVDRPVFSVTIMHFQFPRAEMDRQIVPHVVVVLKVALDKVPFVPERDKELGEPCSRVYLHDVPEDGTPADFDHRLGLDVGLLGQSSPESARQDRDFHQAPPLSHRCLGRPMAHLACFSRHRALPNYILLPYPALFRSGNPPPSASTS